MKHTFRYKNVLKFVILELSEEEDGCTLKYWSSELRFAINRAGVNYQWCVDLMSDCLNSVEVKELVTELVTLVVKNVDHGDEIIVVNNNSAIAAVTLLIPHAQPSRVEVNICEQEPSHLEQLVEQLSLHHTRSLRLMLNYSYLHYEPSDNVVKHLKQCR